MESYDTLSQALNALKKLGYTSDFNLLENCVECKELQESFEPDSFYVKEVHRFEGMSSVDDMSVLYAIETDSGVKGTLVDAYGTYSEAISPEMLKKLQLP